MDPDTMSSTFVVGRTNDAVAMGRSRHLGQQLADLHARNAGRDRVELATHRAVGIGFGVECFLVRRAARGKQQDATLRATPAVANLLRSR